MNDKDAFEKLDFLFVGPMKTGTSWLHEYLAWHDTVNVPSTVKETFYFTRNYHKGSDWYASQFGEAEDGQLCGEVSPTYFPDVEAARRIYQQNPDTKILITLREPFKRFLSHYNHNVRAGFVDPESPLDLVYKNIEGMQSHARYFENIKMWIDQFGEDNVFVLYYEELDKEPQDFVGKMCNYLGISELAIPAKLDKKVGHGRVPVNTSLVKLVSRIVKYLRGNDFHALVNFGKKIGINNVLYAKAKNTEFKYSGEAETIVFLQTDAVKLEAELGLDISLWREMWNKQSTLTDMPEN